ncbi:hypothetical protein LAZ67_4001341 [Cordylochernes scorpioides]|uniref:Reverse transcriptase domain-containing protein n=1 Tax=Cordylochernes scorpioides TaxID=51811 RepID=A0ABY6KEV0_9ARAC|nr:hypothetical protein LAZ67_4001341 [Cordylochernes scorpioides]
MEESEQKENEEPQFQINENLSYKEKEQFKLVLEKYADLFSSGLGRSNLAKHQIDTEGAKPIKHKPYTVIAKEREIIKEKIDEILSDGIIRPTSSPWSFPVILVKKRNELIEYWRHTGFKYFSAIDLQSGYWQVEVEEKDKEKTAFTTAHDLYEFNVMFFGLCNAPATFERNMENMLGRPKFQRTDENVQKITDLIKENPRTTLLELEKDTGISKTTIGRIVTEDLKLKKTPAKFIPRFLTNEQKLCRLATCEDMMEMTRTDPEWKDKIITGDETWVYGYDPETKPQSAEWRDIAPNDFFLFPKLKAVLKGRHFDTRDDIIEKSPLALKSIPKEAYKNCFDNWEKRWRCHIHVKCNSTCVRSVVMKSNREFENRAAIIVALRAGRSPKEIVDFLKLPKTTIYRVKKQFDEADSNKEGIATRKKHSRRSDRVRGEEFVKNVKEKIDGNPGKSMRAIAKEMDVGSMTIVRTIHEDLGLKSYALRKGQLLTENMKNNRKGKAAALLNNLKHDSFGMLRFFSDEKNFDVDQKVNPRNDRWICKDPSEIPVVMHTKFPASVMVLGVISSEGDVMPPHFFEKGLRMNADTYINVLETVVKPWMDMVAAGRKYVFQQDSAPAHKAKKTQSWLTLNVPSHWGPDIWPPNSPDCNPLDYYVWGVVERDVNKAPHTTIQSVKKAVHTVMTQMDKVIVAKACASFRTRLETAVANNGNYIE